MLGKLVKDRVQCLAQKWADTMRHTHTWEVGAEGSGV